MTKIIKIDNHWRDEEARSLTDELKDKDEDFVVVRDSNMEVFEYDDLENITAHADDVKEVLEETEDDEERFGDSLFGVDD